jgi:adenylate cyclase
MGARHCPGLPLALRLQRRATLAGFTVNAVSAVMVGLYMTVVFPPDGDTLFLTPAWGLATVVLYTIACGITSYRSAAPVFDRMRTWLAEERPPTPEERRAVLRLPVFFARMTVTRWALAVPVFGLPLLTVSREFALDVATTIVLAGISTAAAVYLATERLLRPAFALALDPSAPPEARSLGLGFLGTKLASQAVASPVRQLRRAVDAVTHGDLDVSVRVDDGSEVGRLQAGFNGMVAGLREREQLRDLYGRQVGANVAREALERGTALGGATCEVSALFVDVVGSTRLGHRESPERVVAMLNEFFAAVVQSVHEHGGLVNKFEGDAALCVFGAPVPQPDHAARARVRARPAHPHRRARLRDRRRDRRRLRRGRGGLRRGRDALRVHGRRRPGQRGGAPDRARQAARGAAARER